ncbi:hypothetical protein BJ166DRAFT_342084 [Pestalotiopsis sp. NC0098]|nr:hypothetical protein BJ166DRAFT_342084 [Pestalotiopsis sp. NC0098]
MVAKYTAALIAVFSAPAFAGPVYRLVDALDQDVYQQAQQRDDTATRALSNVNIKTSKGKCLFVDALSGDSAANLTPIQVAACGATDGQGFDVITQGKHNDAAGSILIVSTLTQACFTFDPSLATSKQVMLYSCGGVSDGSGNVTTAQLFPGDGSAGPLTLAPESQPASCFTVKGNSVEIADCEDGNESQTFTFDDGTTSNTGDEKVDVPATATTATSDAVATAPGEQLITVTCEPVTVTAAPVTVTATESVTVTVKEGSTPSEASTDTTSTTTLFITVDPISSTDLAESFSSTTTIFVTIPLMIATSSAAEAASPTPSSKVPSDPNTIPQVSINPSTTVRVTDAPTTSTAAAVATTTAPSSKAPSDPNTIPQISINPSTTVVV